MKLRTLAFALAFGMASLAHADALKNIEIIAPAGQAAVMTNWPVQHNNRFRT